MRPNQKLVDFRGKTYVMLRGGPKNSRLAEIDRAAKERGDDFLAPTKELSNQRSAQELFYPDVPAQPVSTSRTVRLDGEVADRLQQYAGSMNVSVSEAAKRLLDQANV